MAKSRYSYDLDNQIKDLRRAYKQAIEMDEENQAETLAEMLIELRKKRGDNNRRLKVI